MQPADHDATQLQLSPVNRICPIRAAATETAGALFAYLQMPQVL